MKRSTLIQSAAVIVLYVAFLPSLYYALYYGFGFLYAANSLVITNMNTFGLAAALSMIVVLVEVYLMYAIARLNGVAKV
jgi:hypothetical protein